MAINTNLDSDARLQDIVARVSKVSLSRTVDVLVGTVAALHAMGEEDVAERLTGILARSTEHKGKAGAIPMEVAPNVNNVEACNMLYADIAADVENEWELGTKLVDAIKLAYFPDRQDRVSSR